MAGQRIGGLRYGCSVTTPALVPDRLNDGDRNEVSSSAMATKGQPSGP